jgi:GT2 family glycosyltransferase
MLEQALPSIIGQTFRPYEILVVDNRSPASDRIAAIVSRYPAVRLIANKTNPGFAAGMNVGIRQARGEFVYLTEDDIILSDTYLEVLMDYTYDNRNIGVVAGVQYNWISKKTFRFYAGDFPLDGRLTPDLQGWNVPDTGQLTEPYTTGFAIGSMMLIPTDVARALGGFREDYFMYFEDIEFCFRIRRSGRSVVIVPSAKGYHIDPPPGPNTNEIMLQFHRFKNLISLYCLHAGWKGLGRFTAVSAIELVKALLRPNPRRRSLLKAWGSRLQELPSLFRERWRRPLLRI